MFPRPLSLGNKTKVITERGSEVTVRYAIVELSRLITSHDSALQLNKKYPAKLQPRDRARIASAAQINLIARNMRPELLADSVKASDGSPIIGNDYIVESGNARTLALRRVYSAETQKAYVEFLLLKAKALGLNSKAIRNAKQPVLVRIRLSKIERVRFCLECNEQSVAVMSSPEQARIDADKLDAGMLALFQPDEIGNIASASNRDFLRAFIDRAVAPTEQGRFIDAVGVISQDGVRRVQNALVAKAYGDISAIERLSEATEDNVRRVSLVLIKKSAVLACLKLSIEAGARHSFDITGPIARAMRKLSTLRDAGRFVNDYLREGVLIGDDLSQLERRILEVFEQYKNSSRLLEDILQCFVDSVNSLGHPRQGSMLDVALPSIEQLFESAVLRATSPERKAKRLMSRKIQVGAWDRSAAAKKAWITIRANQRALRAKAA